MAEELIALVQPHIAERCRRRSLLALGSSGIALGFGGASSGALLRDVCQRQFVVVEEKRNNLVRFRSVGKLLIAYDNILNLERA